MATALRPRARGGDDLAIRFAARARARPGRGVPTVGTPLTRNCRFARVRGPSGIPVLLSIRSARPRLRTARPASSDTVTVRANAGASWMRESVHHNCLVAGFAAVCRRPDVNAYRTCVPRLRQLSAESFIAGFGCRLLAVFGSTEADVRVLALVRRRVGASHRTSCKQFTARSRTAVPSRDPSHDATIPSTPAIPT